MGSPLANIFLARHEQDWLYSCPLEYRKLYYPRYVDDIFVLILVNRCFWMLVNAPSTVNTFKRDIPEKWLSRKLH